jgi:hypothetical protein
MYFTSSFSSTGTGKSITNTNTIDISGNFTNASNITNGFPGVLSTYFTITNGGACNNSGSITNNSSGEFSFTGTSFKTNSAISNEGSMLFYSSLSSSSTITNDGSIGCTTTPFPTATPYPIMLIST